MNDKPNSEQNQIGIAGLPKRWAIVVQLVGTFGLAVFLVLYYVLFMYPSETARYEKLRVSVEDLMAVVEKQQARLTREQADKLEDLFVSAVASEFCVRAIRGIEKDIDELELARELEDTLMMQVDKLRGLVRRDGSQISELLTNKIRASSIPMYTASRMADRWKNSTAFVILDDCKRIMLDLIGRMQRAK